MVQNVYDLRPLWADFHIVISTWLGTHELSSNSKYVESISAKMLFSVLWNRWSIANKQQYSISFEICTYLFFWNLSVFFVWRITWDKHIQVQLKVVSRYQYFIGNSLHFKKNNNKNRLEILDSNTNSRS